MNCVKTRPLADPRHGAWAPEDSLERVLDTCSVVSPRAMTTKVLIVLTAAMLQGANVDAFGVGARTGAWTVKLNSICTSHTSRGMITLKQCLERYGTGYGVFWKSSGGTTRTCYSCRSTSSYASASGWTLYTRKTGTQRSVAPVRTRARTMARAIARMAAHANSDANG